MNPPNDIHMINALPLKKYRPYLTLDEIKLCFCSIMELPKPLSQEESRTARILEKFISEIELGLRKENFISSHSRRVFPAKDRSISSLIIQYSDTKLEGMTPEEITTVKEYLFENDLMTPEESEAHISSLFNKEPTP